MRRLHVVIDHQVFSPIINKVVAVISVNPIITLDGGFIFRRPALTNALRAAFDQNYPANSQLAF